MNTLAHNFKLLFYVHRVLPAYDCALLVLLVTQRAKGPGRPGTGVTERVVLGIRLDSSGATHAFTAELHLQPQGTHLESHC